MSIQSRNIGYKPFEFKPAQVKELLSRKTEKKPEQTLMGSTYLSEKFARAQQETFKERLTGHPLAEVQKRVQLTTTAVIDVPQSQGEWAQQVVFRSTKSFEGSLVERAQGAFKLELSTDGKIQKVALGTIKEIGNTFHILSIEAKVQKFALGAIQQISNDYKDRGPLSGGIQNVNQS